MGGSPDHTLAKVNLVSFNYTYSCLLVAYRQEFQIGNKYIHNLFSSSLYVVSTVFFKNTTKLFLMVGAFNYAGVPLTSKVLQVQRNIFNISKRNEFEQNRIGLTCW